MNQASQAILTHFVVSVSETLIRGSKLQEEAGVLREIFEGGKKSDGTYPKTYLQKQIQELKKTKQFGQSQYSIAINVHISG